MNLVAPQLKRLVLLSGPLLIVKVNVPIRGFAVTWILAQLGIKPLAAGALAYSLHMVLLSFFLGALLSSIGSCVARAIGADDDLETTCLLQQGLWLGALLAIPCMIILYNASPLLLLLGQDESIVELSAQFAAGLAWIFIPYTVVLCSSKLLININKPHIPMLYSLLGLTISIFMSYGLALGKWGLPELNIAGVSSGLAIAYWVQAILLFFYIRFGKVAHKYKVFSNFLCPKWHYLCKLWRIGWPVGLKYNIEFFLFFVFASIIGVFAHSDLPVYQVVLQFFIISSCLSTGVGLATVSLVGQAIGRKEIFIIKPTCYAGLLLTASYIGIFFIIIFQFNNLIAGSFFPEKSYEFNLLISILIIVVAYQFLDGLHKIITDIFVAFKENKLPLVVNILGFWGFGLPIGCILSIYFQYGLIGILWGLMIGAIFTIITMAITLYYKLNSVNNMELYRHF